MSHALFIAWRSGDAANGRWGPVGRLDYLDGRYRFAYTEGAKSLEGFRPFPGMPILNTVYESAELFPLFANRILTSSRPEYEAFLVWGGFDPHHPPDPITILGVTEGRRATDTLEVFPCPMPDADGRFVNKFFLHGIRWMPPAALQRIERLKPGERLGLMLDITNAHDRHAVAVRTCDPRERFLIGYVPRYLAHDLGELSVRCEPDLMAVTVERVNADAPLQQRLLCRMSSNWPSGFRPCRRDEFRPIVPSQSATTEPQSSPP